MYQTSGRLLALLGLMQSRPMWRGAELASRLQVSGRDVQAEDLAAAKWVPRETWDTVPHALAP